ncbi:hypothetical protein TNCV_3667291 [Trichonephila clavipes]|nr:hypothetical protein TNCV_3667291 [Trichonephila clavipes]
MQATVRYPYHSATAATLRLPEIHPEYSTIAMRPIDSRGLNPASHLMPTVGQGEHTGKISPEHYFPPKVMLHTANMQHLEKSIIGTPSPFLMHPAKSCFSENEIFETRRFLGKLDVNPVCKHGLWRGLTSLDPNRFAPSWMGGRY